jgi:hypothetical protein
MFFDIKGRDKAKPEPVRESGRMWWIHYRKYIYIRIRDPNKT